VIIAEAGLELVPTSMWNHPSVINNALKVGRRPDEVLLDTSYHYRAMTEQNLSYWWKRGRPDIVHFSLLAALSTPLYMQRRLNVYISTLNNKLILINDNLRLPKSYSRFEGLMLKLFRDKSISDPEKSRKLIELKDDITFEGAIAEIIKPDKLIGFSTRGVKCSISQILVNTVKGNAKNYCFVIGGFQRGHFQKTVLSALDNIYSISNFGLESHVVISRILYECEKQFNETQHPPRMQ
jgi:rRNA small subunit pseudouridine methyltransferase Nep1